MLAVSQEHIFSKRSLRLVTNILLGRWFSLTSWLCANCWSTFNLMRIMGRFRLGAKLKSKSLCLNYDLLAHEKFPNWDCFQKCFTTVSWSFLNCFICSFSTPLPWCTETHLSVFCLIKHASTSGRKTRPPQLKTCM